MTTLPIEIYLYCYSQGKNERNRNQFNFPLEKYPTGKKKWLERKEFFAIDF